MEITPRVNALFHLGQGTYCKYKGESQFYRSLLDQVGVDYLTQTQIDQMFPDGNVPAAMVANYGRRTRCFIHKEQFDKWPVEHGVAALAHEARHILQHSLLRSKGLDQRLYNYASDLVINEALLDGEFKLPDNWVTIKNIRKAAKEQTDPQQIEAYKKFLSLVDANFKTHDTTEEQVYSWLDKCAVPQDFDGDVVPGDGSEAEGPASNKVKVAGAAAAVRNRADRGELPAWLEREIEEVLVEKPSWPDEIRDWMMSFDETDYSWNKPDGIVLANYELFLPDFWSDAMDELVVVVDTSGSISQEILNEFAGHISAGIAIVKPKRVHVVYCDAEVNHVEVFDSPTRIDLKPHGGGGTDFRPAIEWTKENAPNAAGLVYFTDGYGCFGDDPGIPVLWAVMSGCLSKDQIPYGRYVEVTAG